MQQMYLSIPLISVLALGACAVPQNDAFRYSPAEARSCFAQAIVQMKLDPTGAAERFDISAITERIQDERPEDQVAEETVRKELSNLFTSIEDDLPRVLPPAFVEVTKFSQYAEDKYELEARIPLNSPVLEQFRVTLTPDLDRPDGCVITSFWNAGFSISAIISGKIETSIVADPFAIDTDGF